MAEPVLIHPGKYRDHLPKRHLDRWKMNHPGASAFARFMAWVRHGLLRKPVTFLRYEVLGVTVTWGDLDWYVPPEEYQRFLRHVIARYQGKVQGDPFEAARGGQVKFTTDKPMPGKHGITFPEEKRSFIHAPFVFDVEEHEVSLWFQHVFFGDRDEGWDIQKMAELGIRFREYPGAAEQAAWRMGEYGA